MIVKHKKLNCGRNGTYHPQRILVKQLLFFRISKIAGIANDSILLLII